MEMQLENIHTAIDNPTVKSLVSTYLLALAYAEMMRGKVDEVYLSILTETPVYADGQQNETGERIYKAKDLYLCSDDGLCQQIYAEADRRLRTAGIKPSDMSDEHCPALVAETDLSNIGRELIDVSGIPLGVTHDDIMCGADGLENRQKWIDLVVGAVISLPDFESPLGSLTESLT